MTTATLLAPTSSGVGDDVDHYYCCDDDIGLCGADLTGMAYMDRGPDWDCPLCVLVLEAGTPCGVPGCQP